MKNPMLRLMLIIGVTILILMAGVASAGPRGGFAPRRMAPPPREAPVARVQEQRPAEAPGPQGPPQQRSGRMSPEERSALRRQIRDDSRSVYRPMQPYPR